MKKKLIEVALPLEAINAASVREKSIRHGHPSTLHLWWARRPLAACRAVLFAFLVDDPSSRPEEFLTEADQQKERQRLFELIEEMVKWENTNNEEVLAQARAEIMKSTGGNPPPVLDPFCGGGSIPLEAQRLWTESNHLQVKDLWNYLTTYCYLPRLKDESVLRDAIQEGLLSDEFFGYAQGITLAGDYLGLRLGLTGPAVVVDRSGYLVKPEIARQKLLESRPQPDYRDSSGDTPRPPYPPGQPDGGFVGDPSPPSEIPEPETKIRRFYASSRLDSARVGRDAGRIAEEVIQHLAVLDGAEVEVTLEIQVKVADGIGDNVVRIVNENCKTLKFDEFGFEEE